MKRKKNNKSFIESLLDKEKLSEDDFIKLDNIWRQFLIWKTSHGGLLNTNPNKHYFGFDMVGYDPNEDIDDDTDEELNNLDKSYNRAREYIDYMKSYEDVTHFDLNHIKNVAHFDYNENVKFKTGYND